MQNKGVKSHKLRTWNRYEKLPRLRRGAQARRCNGLEKRGAQVFQKGVMSSYPGIQETFDQSLLIPAGSKVFLLSAFAVIGKEGNVSAPAVHINSTSIPS